MAKIVKLFRSPDAAERALALLSEKGFGGDETAVALRPMEQNRSVTGKLAHPSAFGITSEFLAAGPLSGPLKGAKEELATLLVKELEIPAEQGVYYEFALQIGGILIAVYTDDTKAPLARQTLKSAEVLPGEQALSDKSPGFVRADRMVASHPIDASMSGDFRNY
ncbi:hypothetical protein ACFLWB_02400 [Chloroflexota bacterium]